MAIVVDPSKMLRRLAPKRTVQRLVSRKLTVNRAALTLLARQDFLSKNAMEKIAIKVIRGYKERYKDELAQGETKSDAFEAATNGRKQMVQRVQNAMVFEISSEIKKAYRGEYYTWLPSNAVEPDPIHQLNYGQTFRIGVGEMPGERNGCMCGMEIQVKEEQLKLV